MVYFILETILWNIVDPSSLGFLLIPSYYICLCFPVISFCRIGGVTILRKGKEDLISDAEAGTFYLYLLLLSASAL